MKNLAIITILTPIPIFSIINNRSLAKDVIEKSKAGIVLLAFSEMERFSGLVNSLHKKPVLLDMNMFDQFTAKSKTQEQVKLFNEGISKITEKSKQ